MRQYFWVVLPNVSITQNMFLQILSKTKKGNKSSDSTTKKSVVGTRHITQADGSKMPMIVNKFMDASQMAHKIGNTFPDLGLPATEIKVGAEELRRIVSRLTVDDIVSMEEWVYFAYKTHSFLNGDRYIPILYRKSYGGYYRMQEYFSEYVPEDRLGVLVEDVKQLDTDVLVLRNENILEFINYVRLCHCCGRVSDLSSPLSKPFLKYADK